MRGSLTALMLALILPLPALAGQVTVKPGETLSEIADRYGISVSRLMSLNGLQRANHVEAGTVLQIPGSGGGRSASTGASGRGGSVTVQRGQTLSEIAEQQGISLTTLMRLNGISDPDQVVAGQQLRLSGGGTRSAASGTSRGGGSVTVQRGQTLSEIAEQQGTSLATLMRINGISDPDQVVAGQQLRLPGRTNPSAASTPSRYPQNASVHLVRPGESLSGIASGYGVPMGRLVALNGISDPDHVEPGTRLKLKGKPAVSAPVASQTRRPSATAPATATATATASKGHGSSVASAAPVRPRSTATSTTARATTSATASSTATASAATGKPARTPAAAAPSATTTHAASSPSAAASSSAATAAGSTTAAAATPAVNRPTVASTRPQSTTPSPAVQTSLAPASTALNTQAKATAPNTTASAATAITAATTSAASTTAAASPRPSIRPVTGASATRSSSTVATARADWRTYGPLQINWTAWQPMGGSMVAPSLNAKGQTFYTAINCGARKLNATTISGEWQAWSDPSAEYEQQLLSDYCRSRS